MNKYRTISGTELDLTPEQAEQLARLTDIELIGKADAKVIEGKVRTVREVELVEKG